MAMWTESAPPMVCMQCGTPGRPRRYTKGSIIVELLLWLMMILPGFLYSLWRLSSRYDGCPTCGAPHMVPSGSPRAKALLGE
jgi:hypothetical protein